MKEKEKRKTKGEKNQKEKRRKRSINNESKAETMHFTRKLCGPVAVRFQRNGHGCARFQRSERNTRLSS